MTSEEDGTHVLNSPPTDPMDAQWTESEITGYIGGGLGAGRAAHDSTIVSCIALNAA